jgi:hypothetical protein
LEKKVLNDLCTFISNDVMFPSEQECSKAFYNENHITYNTDPNSDNRYKEDEKYVYKPIKWQDDPNNIINKDKMK